MQGESTSRDTMIMAAGAMMVSFAPVFVKLLIGRGVAPTTIAAWRMLIGAALFAGLALGRRQRLWLPGPVVVAALAAALFFAIDLFVWHRSIVYVGAGMATILANTQVFWMALLGRIVFGERLTLLLALAAPLGFVGVVLLVGVGSELSLSRGRLLGLAYGLGTGVAYASYMTALKRSSKRLPDGSTPPGGAARLTTIALASAAMLFAGGAVEGADLRPGGPASLALCGALALGPQVLGWMLIDRALGRLTAARGALLLLLQPTFATIWGAVMFAEKLSASQIIGAVITLTAVFLGSYKPSRREKAQ